MGTEEGFDIEKDGEIIVSVKWLNKYNESRSHYDIGVTENGEEHYIEVKSTKTDDKEWFEVSRRQWELSQEEGDKFSIYRIYGAGTEKPKLIKICNPSKLWQEGGIIAYPVRIQL